jgi:hypothetical protein
MSTLTVTNIKKTGDTVSRDVSGVAAAWVNFNGTGTVVIRDSVNISSLIDTGTGVYNLSFSNDMAAANYVSHSSTNRSNVYGNPYAITTSNITLASYYAHGTTVYDVEYYHNSVLGDLA